MMMSNCLKFPDAVPELFGESVYLRELTEEDIPAWFERATDSESADLAGDPIPESIEMGLTWLHKHRQQFYKSDDAGDCFLYVLSRHSPSAA